MTNKTLDLINDLVEYMEEKSDADYNYEAERFKPNEEMQLLVRLQEIQNILTTLNKP